MTALQPALVRSSRSGSARPQTALIGRAPVAITFAPAEMVTPMPVPQRGPVRQTEYDAGPFAITLPETWRVVAENTMVLGRPMRMVIRENGLSRMVGGAMVYQIQMDGRSLGDVVDAERQLWESLFERHGQEFAFAGYATGSDGHRNGFTFRRQRDGVAFYETILVVTAPHITYGVRVYTPVAGSAMAADLQIARSFTVKA